MVLMVGRALMVRMPLRLFPGRGRGRLRPGRVLVMVRGLGVLGLVAGCVMVRVMGVMVIRVGLRAMVVSVIAMLSLGFRGAGMLIIRLCLRSLLPLAGVGRSIEVLGAQM